ncbi:hypothetical protein [Salana multivorans]|uniref:hypothetical protein n=1 Tax=Salana multivorans TaxID=120377 RepID=UPI00319E6051
MVVRDETTEAVPELDGYREVHGVERAQLRGLEASGVVVGGRSHGDDGERVEDNAGITRPLGDHSPDGSDELP